MTWRHTLQTTRFGIRRNFYKIFESFLGKRYQRVALNRAHSDWVQLKIEIPRGFILESLYFLNNIYGISAALHFSVLLFADDTSKFSVSHDKALSANKLNDDLKKIQTGHINDRCPSIQTLPYKLKRLHFHIDLTNSTPTTKI